MEPPADNLIKVKRTRIIFGVVLIVFGAGSIVLLFLTPQMEYFWLPIVIIFGLYYWYSGQLSKYKESQEIAGKLQEEIEKGLQRGKKIVWVLFALLILYFVYLFLTNANLTKDLFR